MQTKCWVVRKGSHMMYSPLKTTEDPIQMSSSMKPKGPPRAASKARKTPVAIKVRRIAAPRMNPGGGLRAAPTAISRQMVSNEPRVTKTGRSMRIQHRELVLTTIAGSTTFIVQSSLSLNPGLAATFPWLAPQAQQWEQYTVHRLRAEYVPIAPTSTQGDIVLSSDYDASDPAPSTEQQAGNARGSITASCWEAFDMSLDPKAMMGLGPRKFVRPCAIAGDIKTFDVGKIFVSSNNETGTTAIGKLYLDYDFEFFVPQNSPSPDTAPQQTSQFLSHVAQTLSTATTTNVTSVLSVDPLSIGAQASSIWTPPAGVYTVSCSLTCADNTVESFNAALYFAKNGAELAYYNQYADSTTGGHVCLHLTGIAIMNGTDTFSIQVNLTGAAGILTVTSCQVLFSLA